MSSNCINRQKALRVRFCDQQDLTLLFFKYKKIFLDRSDLFIAENHKSVNCVSRALQECYSRRQTEVDEKGLMSPDCEDAVSIQLVVVFPWFGNRSQEAVCPVFGNIAFLVNSVQLSPALFY